MKALVLEKVNELSIRDIDIKEEMGPRDVKIAIKNVGVCGSDVHFYERGVIGHFVVREPMVLGHEASGQVVEVGKEVKNLKPGDRVCMEPGIPDPDSKATRMGMYNLDPGVRFWAAPPVHGCLRPYVVHPATLTFKLPDNVSYAEGAMVEPLAIGMQAAKKALIEPGDIGVVLGCGTIGIMTALAAVAGGCSKIIITDVQQEKLDIAANMGPIIPVNIKKESVEDVIARETEGWGADIVFEASGNQEAVKSAFNLARPGGTVVFVGMPGEPVPLLLEEAMVKELRIETVFRYSHMYPKSLQLLGSGKIDLKPLITDIFPFEKSIEAFDYAKEMPPTSVKVQIELGEE
jgi:D-xylulose reductase